MKFIKEFLCFMEVTKKFVKYFAYFITHGLNIHQSYKCAKIINIKRRVVRP